MRAYLRFSLSVLARGRLLWLSAAVLAAFVLLPHFSATPAYDGVLEDEQHQESLTSLESGLSNNEFVGASDDFIDFVKREVELLRIVVESDDPAKRYEALGAYDLLDYEGCQRGHIFTSAPKEIFLASGTFFTALSKRPDPAVYDDASLMPAFEYLAFSGKMVPAPVWALPVAAAIAAVLGEDRDGRLLGSVPASGVATRLAALLSMLLCAALAAGLSLIAVFALVAIRNGVGDPSGPVVVIMGTEVAQKTVSTALLEGAALHLLGYAFLAALALLIHTVVPKRTAYLSYVLAVLALMVASVPLMDGVINEENIAVASLLPTTYLDTSIATGSLVYEFLGDLFHFPEVTVARGALVLALSFAVCLALALVLATARAGRTMSRKGGAIHAAA